MEKVYKANLEYNRSKRHKAIVLCTLLFLGIGGLMSVFIVKGDMDFILMTGAFLIFPIMLLPASLMQHPVDGRDILKITDKTITIHKETYKIKDIVKFNVILELPASKLDSENQKLLEKMKTEKLDDDWFGNLDFMVKDEKGKKKMLYTHIDNVVDAMNNLFRVGLKHYEVSFALKKNKVVSTYDFRSDVLNEESEQDKQYKALSQKDRKKQLL